MKNIAVFFGGKSCEHDVSIITGVLTLNCVNGELFSVIPIYIDRFGLWYTGDSLSDVSFYKNLDYKKLKRVTMQCGSDVLYTLSNNKLKKLAVLSCAINCVHGLNGEDGSLAGLLQLCQVPLVGSDVFSSSFSMDKDFTKVVLSGLNVEKLAYVRLFKDLFYSKTELAVKLIEKKFNYPVIIKPARLGSSIGVIPCKNKEELIDNLKIAFKYDSKIIVEEYLQNFREINCACYKNGDKIVISQCEEPITANEILSFKDKYLSAINQGEIEKKFPADIPKEISNKIRAITQRIYRKCDFSGVIRIDYILHNNKIYVNEINSIPGSLAYYLFSDTLKGFSNLLTNLINSAIIKKLNELNLEYNYSSNVLQIDSVKGGKAKRVDKK